MKKKIGMPRDALAAAFALALALASTLSAAAEEAAKPQIIIFDIATSSYDPGKSRLLTDVMRAELFKTGLFRIIEKGVVQEAGLPGLAAESAEVDDARLLKIGRAARGDKLVISTVEKISATIAISVRIVDVATSLIDYTDNVFLSNESLIFDAIKEIATKIEFFYAAGEADGGKDPAEDLAERWYLLGTDSERITYLVDARVDPEEYLSIRQYDITFTPKQYVSLLQARIDPGIAKSFLQAGVSFSQAERALALGITKLDRYREVFQKAGYGFEDYLEAYSKGIMSIKEYAAHKRGYDRNYFGFGLGGVADSFPIANAAYRFVLAKAGWERYWTPYQRGTWKFSTDAGLFLMNLFAPVPFFQANAYVGAYPYYFKLGAGCHAEVILGGHVGAYFLAGIELLESLDFSVFTVPFGTQPKVSYTDFKSRPGDADYAEIYFPYAGAIVTYKIPANF